MEKAPARTSFSKSHYLYHLQIRIGIHTGHVVAGVIGEKVPRFIVMGEAVNFASRMESHGLPGKIQVSKISYE